jgi:hypothetical protein
MNKIIITAIFIAAVITWIWMIFAWIIALIGA